MKKAERRRIDAFKLSCWRRLLRVPWIARRFNQSILKEISPEYLLEELMLKLKLQYFGHLKVESQRIAQRDKRAFLSDQCKEIEENNRMGKTRDLFKKIRDTKGTCHAKMGSIKDRNGMDLTEAEDIKRWKEYTEKLYKKKIFMTQITTMV